MAQLPCIKRYILVGQNLNTIVTMSFKLADMIFDESFYFGLRA